MESIFMTLCCNRYFLSDNYAQKSSFNVLYDYQ